MTADIKTLYQSTDTLIWRSKENNESQIVLPEDKLYN